MFENSLLVRLWEDFKKLPFHWKLLLPLPITVLVVVLMMGYAATMSDSGREAANANICRNVPFLPFCSDKTVVARLPQPPVQPRAENRTPPSQPVAKVPEAGTPTPVGSLPPVEPAPPVAVTVPVIVEAPDPCSSGTPSDLRRQFCAFLECGQIAKTDEAARVVVDWLLLAEKYGRAASAEAKALSDDLVDFKVHQSAGNLKRVERGHSQNDLACIERQQAFLNNYQSARSALLSKGKPGSTLGPDVKEFLVRYSLVK